MLKYHKFRLESAQRFCVILDVRAKAEASVRQGDLGTCSPVLKPHGESISSPSNIFLQYTINLY